MFRIKWICGLMVIVLLLSACGGSGESTGESQSESESGTESSVESGAESEAESAVESGKDADAAYKTITVQKETFEFEIDIASARTAFYYPCQEVISCEYSGAYIKEDVTWRKGDVVKKGDVLATLTIEGRDEMIEERLQLEYQRISQEYSDQIKKYENDIAALAQSVETAEDAERERLLLEKEKLETEMQVYRLQTGNAVEQAKKALNDYKAQYSDKTIVAPFDGVLSKNFRKTEGEEIVYGDQMFILHKPEEAILAVSVAGVDYYVEQMISELFVQGQAVSIVINREESIAGTIVASPIGTSGGGTVYVAGNEPGAFQELLERGGATVSSVVLTLEDVIVVDSSYTDFELNTSSPGVQNTGYVYLLEDGKVLRHRLLLGPVATRGEDSAKAVVLDGLEEGQIIVISTEESEE